MPAVRRPHVLGIDDGPFEKRGGGDVPLCGVVMEGRDLVEGVALERFPVDGEDVTDFLAGWIGGLRVRPALQAVMFAGVTIAGLAVIDVRDLSERLELPVLVVNRKDPANHRLGEALRAAGLSHRLALVERTPRAFALPGGLHVAAAGTDPETARELVLATRGKSFLPEPVRLAHLVARALVTGESRGRP